MLQKVQALISEYDMLPPGCKVLCAVSGGADSMCLLHLLHTLSREHTFTLTAAHYDHRLRGAEARRDAAFVADWCKENRIALTLGGGDVAGAAARAGQGVEETARQMRYQFLWETAETLGCDRIATAHNADDNLETLLLHLTRGTGLHGLSGIPPRRGALVRPLLTCSRAEIETYLARNHLPHVEDSTNTDTAYARNRLRHQVIPVLRSLNPRLSEHSAQSIAHLRRENDYLNAQASDALQQARRENGSIAIQAAAIGGLPDALAPRAVRLLLAQLPGGSTDFAAAHLNAVVALTRDGGPSAQLSLPHGLTAMRVYEELWLLPRSDLSLPFPPTPLNRNGITAPAGTPWRVQCRPAVCPQPERRAPGTMYLTPNALGDSPLLRPRQIGDEIALPHRSRKTIKKLLIDEKFPRQARDTLPVLAGAAGVAALAGFGPDRRCLAESGQDAYELKFWKDETKDGTCTG